MEEQKPKERFLTDEDTLERFVNKVEHLVKDEKIAEEEAILRVLGKDRPSGVEEIVNSAYLVAQIKEELKNRKINEEIE